MCRSYPPRAIRSAIASCWTAGTAAPTSAIASSNGTRSAAGTTSQPSRIPGASVLLVLPANTTRSGASACIAPTGCWS